jgi:hypothetical protein
MNTEGTNNPPQESQSLHQSEFTQHMPSDGEHIAEPEAQEVFLAERPADIGRVAVASAELPITPEIQRTPEDDAQQVESERKMNTSENIRTLQKRFGERFVKGDLMEGGGYTGGAARELLAGFMDQPGFADQLKRLIPNKHGALKVLKDNHAYIQATLEKQYKDDPSHEKAPAKNPYELARSVGYELTGPFESTGEFVGLDRQDFRTSDHLCTFNDPTGRLKGYHILWLRQTDVSDTLPADQLAQDTLSDAWKTYLKTIGRYDQDLDAYDLTNLRPTREDPYGISSMSVQISRTGTAVSIKNRYNHTVGNPDNTLDSNLDNVAYGLKRAVYSKVGREDLMDKTSVALAEGYIADNEGGIHHYQYEEDNIYYGDYGYINNGVVTTIDRGKYYMISPQLYAPMNGKGDELRLGQRASDLTGLEVCSDVRFLYESSKAKHSEKDLHIAELRLTYTERDQEQLKVVLVETLKDQYVAAYAAYSEVAEQVSSLSRSDRAVSAAKRMLFGRRHEAAPKPPLTEVELTEVLDTKLKEWEENGTITHLIEKLIKQGTRHTIVATPEAELTQADIVNLFEQFGEGQPIKTYVADIYKNDTIDRDALAPGVTPGSKGVSVALVPSNTDYELNDRTADTQSTLLDARLEATPHLKHRVPTLLEALTYWKTLRAGGDLLTDGAYEKTAFRLFKHAKLGSDALVPFVYVRDGGKPCLINSGSGNDDSGRLLVG